MSDPTRHKDGVRRRRWQASALLAALVTGAATASIACDLESAPAAPVAAPVETTPARYEPDDEATIPCAPRRVLVTICQQCHQRSPLNGAPFPLVTRSNIVRTGPDGEIRALMIEQIEVGRMPLSPVTIDYDSREALLDWLHAGAPAVSPRTCDDAGPDDSSDAAAPPEESPAPEEAPDEASPPDASADD